MSIITRNFSVIRNKQPMTIGTNRKCISRDDNCVNTMCFSRQLPTTAIKLLTYDDLLSLLSSTGVIRVVLPVSYLLVSYFVVNFLRRVTRHISNKLFIIREVNSDMPIYILNRTNAGKNPARGI